MKKIYLIPMLLLIMLGSCGRLTDNQALEYNEAMVDLLDDLIVKQDAVTDAIVDYVPDEMQSSLNAFKEEISEVKKQMKAKDDTGNKDGVEGFHKACLDYVDTMDEIVVLYEKIIEIENLPDEEYNDEVSEQYMEYAEQIDDLGDEAMIKVQEEQEKFASEYNFDLY